MNIYVSRIKVNNVKKEIFLWFNFRFAISGVVINLMIMILRWFILREVKKENYVYVCLRSFFETKRGGGGGGKERKNSRCKKFHKFVCA